MPEEFGVRHEKIFICSFINFKYNNTTKPYPKFNDISTSKLLQFIDAYGQLFVPPAM